MSVRNSRTPVKNGKAAGAVTNTDGLSQNPDLKSPESPGPVADRTKARRTKAGGPGDTNGRRGALPELLGGLARTNGVATARPGSSPRGPFTLNTLARGDHDETGEEEAVDGGNPPDFVDSQHQRTAGDGQPGEFGPDWVALVTGSNKAEYLVLAKIAFWFATTRKGRLKVRECRHGRWWLYKTYRQLVRDVRVLTLDEVRWAVRRLEASGILITDHDPAGGKPKLYRINPLVVAAKVEEAERRLAGAVERGSGGSDDDESA